MWKSSWTIWPYEEIRAEEAWKDTENSQVWADTENAYSVQVQEEENFVYEKILIEYGWVKLKNLQVRSRSFCGRLRSRVEY